jgi:hypothetical protein
MPGYRVLVGAAVGLVLISLVLGAAAEDKANLAEPGAKSDATAAKAVLRNWPGFRGPKGIGHAKHTNPPLKWSAKGGINIRWKVAIPKHGMSSPIGDAMKMAICFKDRGRVDTRPRRVESVNDQASASYWPPRLASICF